MRTKIIPFVKMSGAGNDFVIIDEAQRRFNYKKLAIQICERTTGIGADGLLVLAYSRKADYRMRIINADGSEAEMCGNGARCLAAYIFKNKKPRRKSIALETRAGIIQCEEADGKGGAPRLRGSSALLRAQPHSSMFTGNATEGIKIQLSKPVGFHPDIPLKIHNRSLRVHFINTGVPHAIVFVEGLEGIDVEAIGKAIRWHKKFSPRGTNVNFVEQIDQGTIAIRTFERGVEGETKACGTGSVAAAIVTHLKSSPQTIYQRNVHLNVMTQSGETLEVIFDNNRKNILNVWLKGSAKLIAEGQYYLD